MMEIDTVSKKKEQTATEEVKNLLLECMKGLKQALETSERESQVLLGSQQGSITTLVKLSESCFKFLNLLEQAMDKTVKSNLMPDRHSRENFRKVKLEGSEQAQQHVIDGDFIESYSALDQKKQTQTLLSLFGGNKDFVTQYAQIINKDLRTILSCLKDLH